MAQSTESEVGPQRVSIPGVDEIAAAFPSLEVLGRIGVGGMGCVFRVRERSTGREMALKVLPRERASDPEFVERFEREAQLLSRLRHPNIVAIHGHGQSGGFCYLLTEFVDGANLRQAMGSGRFAPSQTLALIPAICDALQYAHSQGVLHRDIKPENILLDADGRVKLVDFGIAKIISEPGVRGGDVTLTRTGSRVGTPHYMAPEQVERPEAVDHRADIYSLGVIFYEMLTGELPLGRFSAPSDKASLDARVDEIVFRALAKERELRQQSAEQVKQEVEQLGRKPPVVPPNRVAILKTAGGIWLFLVLVMAVKTGSILQGLLGSFATVPLLLFGILAYRYLTEMGTFQRILGEGWKRKLFLGGMAVAFTIAAIDLLGVAPGPEPSSAGRWALMGLILVLAVVGSGMRSLHRLGPIRDWLLGFLLLAMLVTVLPWPPARWRQDGPPRGLSLPRGRPDLYPGASTVTPLWEDPVTGQALWRLGVGRTNPAPGTIVAASPRHPDGRRVLLGDGSVHLLSETEFWNRLALGGELRPDEVPALVGEPLPSWQAQLALESGATLVSLNGDANGVGLLAIELGVAFEAIGTGLLADAVAPIHAALRVLPWDPRRRFYFGVRPNRLPGTRMDWHETLEAERGGLLAILAVLAARSGDAAALDSAQERGRSLWAPDQELVLCRRRLEGKSDQDWEEIRMKASDVLALRPGMTHPMTVITHFKASPSGTRTNSVDLAWPRIVVPHPSPSDAGPG